jgi:hypothetical protein
LIIAVNSCKKPFTIQNFSFKEVELIIRFNQLSDKKFGKDDFVLQSFLQAPALNNDLFNIS